MDGFAPDTPIGEIVDSCRIWESHSDPEKPSDGTRGQKGERQSGDSRTRERIKPVLWEESSTLDEHEQNPVFEIGVNQGTQNVDNQLASLRAMSSMITRFLQLTQNEPPGETQLNQPAVEVPVRFSCGRQDHGINRCSRVNSAFPFLPLGWSVTMNNGQYRATRTERSSSKPLSGNEGWSGRDGQPPGPSEIKVRLTLAEDCIVQTSGPPPHGSSRRYNRRVPTGRRKYKNSQPWELGVNRFGKQRKRNGLPFRVPRSRVICQRFPRDQDLGNPRERCDRRESPPKKNNEHTRESRRP